MPYRAEVISHRRERVGRAVQNVTSYAYFRTKREATEAAKSKADEHQVAWVDGGDYLWGTSWRTRKDTAFRPDRRLPRPKKRPPVARRDAQGRYRDRRGRYIKGGRKEAMRRIRISKALRRRSAAIRRAKDAARTRYGVWTDSIEELGAAGESPPSFDVSWVFYEPEAMTFEE